MEVKRAGSGAGSSHTASQENEAPSLHSRCVHSDSFQGQSCRSLPSGEHGSAETLDEDAHQHIAREMNLSETAFIRKLQPTDDFTQSSRFGLRWFTPETEFPLCGHATLASAAVLFQKRKLNPNSTLTFVTMSGELKARRAEDGIVLDFPLYPACPQDSHEVEGLIKAAIGDTLVQDIRYSPDTRNLLVRLSDSYDRSFLESLKVNTEPLPRIEKTGKVRGLILTLKGEPGGQTAPYDFYSRYFAPWVGVAEDPVTVVHYTCRSKELVAGVPNLLIIAMCIVRREGPPTLFLAPTGLRNWGRRKCECSRRGGSCSFPCGLMDGLT
ncbi:Phenazine biosynthesis-like domain-containing protein 2 [Apodemus speciosus]|uniref:Phenazine biosynthesis-like domain-containing protein 2 n=1 Tax=Apodemus speciosus TaxID=105296 RepID=A0ABQ0F7U6_APOSI